MGWLDEMQARGRQRVAEAVAAVHAQLPPEAPRAVADEIPVRGPVEAVIAWYIGWVGLAPADVYGIVPSVSNDSIVAVTIVYLDRPEYAAARARLQR